MHGGEQVKLKSQAQICLGSLSYTGSNQKVRVTSSLPRDKSLGLQKFLL